MYHIRHKETDAKKQSQSSDIFLRIGYTLVLLQTEPHCCVCILMPLKSYRLIWKIISSFTIIFDTCMEIKQCKIVKQYAVSGRKEERKLKRKERVGEKNNKRKAGRN